MSPTGRYLVLLAAVLGWLCAGVQMGITSLAMRPASVALLDKEGALDLERYQQLSQLEKRSVDEGGGNLTPADREQLENWNVLTQRWFGWIVCAFLFGAATGGWLFGRLGDRVGRAKALAVSMLWFGSVSAACHYAPSLPALLALWFVSCLGIGGTWPNGVSLLAEAWSELSRPMVAGIMGAAANIGIFLMGRIALEVAITPEDWRWVFVLSAIPAGLSIIAFAIVPESPRWLEGRIRPRENAVAASASTVFRLPYLRVTIVGIALATVPLIGGWGSANWMVPWADEAGQAADPPNPYLKADVNQYRSIAGIIGSLLGGWIASLVGRRRAYALVSFGALFCAQYIFRFTVPTDASFLYWVAALGFFNGVYFGWLPLFLPELFPTRIRATGSGVSFNFGRILTAATVFATAALTAKFDGDYAKIGRATSFIFALGMVVICLAPDTSKRSIEDEPVVG